MLKPCARHRADSQALLEPFGRQVPLSVPSDSRGKSKVCKPCAVRRLHDRRASLGDCSRTESEESLSGAVGDDGVGILSARARMIPSVLHHSKCGDSSRHVNRGPWPCPSPAPLRARRVCAQSTSSKRWQAAANIHGHQDETEESWPAEVKAKIL